MYTCLLAGCMGTENVSYDAERDTLTMNMDEVITLENTTPSVTIPVAEENNISIPQKTTFKLEKNLVFEFDSIELTEAGKSNLESIVLELRKYPQAIFTVVGYTCSAGPASYNDVLSMQRAKSIRNLLQEKYNINNAIKIVGSGIKDPVESNDTKTGRKANRRVEIYVEQ